MTDATASDSPRVSSHLDDSDPPWPLRPWIMAAICAAAAVGAGRLGEAACRKEA